MASFNLRDYTEKGRRAWLTHQSRVQAAKDNKYVSEEDRGFQGEQSLERFRKEVAALKEEARTHLEQERSGIFDELKYHGAQAAEKERAGLKGQEAAVMLTQSRLQGLNPTQMVQALQTARDETERFLILHVGLGVLRTMNTDGLEINQAYAVGRFREQAEAQTPETTTRVARIRELDAAEQGLGSIDVEAHAAELSRRFKVGNSPDVLANANAIGAQGEGNNKGAEGPVIKRD